MEHLKGRLDAFALRPCPGWMCSGLLCMSLLLCLGLSSEADPPVQCGDTLGPGGSFVLEADLACPGDESQLILINGATLDLQGHTLQVDAPVRLAGQGARLHNGRVTLCGPEMCTESIAVLAIGSGHWMEHLELVAPGGDGIDLSGHGHHVDDVTIVADFGVVISGRENRVSRVSIPTPLVGCTIDGNDNLLSQVSVDSANEGYIIIGNGNRLIGTAALAYEAYQVVGDRNLLLWNHAIGAQREGLGGMGFSVRGLQNRLVGNTAEAYQLGAFDASGCTANLWLLNQFETADPPCLLEPPHRRPSTIASGVTAD